MTTVQQIVPGYVENRGMREVSEPNYTPTVTKSPLHCPVVGLVTPKGKLYSQDGIQWIKASDFTKTFGNVLDEKTPYYNPIGLQVSQHIAGKQDRIGVMRLSNNEVGARVALSAFVQRLSLPVYEREAGGQFKRDVNGAKIPTGASIMKLRISIREDDQASVKEYGQLISRVIPAVPANGSVAAIPETQVYPFLDFYAGVGSDYNRGGLRMGVQDTAQNWKSVADFVKATGVFPVEIQLFEDDLDGTRIFSKTVNSRDKATFTLFQAEVNTVVYNATTGVGSFTNTNSNKKTIPVPQPINKVHLYTDSVDSLCQLMYVVEQPLNTTLVEVGQRPYQQMNPFTAQNHNGVPYYGIEVNNVKAWDLSGAVKVKGGIDPFLDKDGKRPSYLVNPVINDPYGLLTGKVFPLTLQQGWDINNRLLALALTTYLDSGEIKNYTRNRMSMIYDVGFQMSVKNILTKFLGSRRDIFIAQDATVWTPGIANDLPTVYSRFTALTTQARMYPESEQWGTATARCYTNLIEANLTGEKTGYKFSMNLDLALAWSEFAGNANGVIVASKSPDTGDQRILRSMHSPSIEWEDNAVGGENFNGGGITLRVYDAGDQLFRPALVTVTSNPDSVLKDAVSVVLGTYVEKILQDEWNVVCGSTIPKADYEAHMKDVGERKCRDALGGKIPQITVETQFTEGTVGSRAIMNVIAHVWFNKGVYMMNMDLYAYNAQDLETAA